MSHEYIDKGNNYRFVLGNHRAVSEFIEPDFQRAPYGNFYVSQKRVRFIGETDVLKYRMYMYKMLSARLWSVYEVIFGTEIMDVNEEQIGGDSAQVLPDRHSFGVGILRRIPHPG